MLISITELILRDDPAVIIDLVAVRLSASPVTTRANSYVGT
jgi:hypothetical protein